MPREVARFLAGAVFGVLVTVAAFYVRERMGQGAVEPAAASRKLKVALRPEERSLGNRDAPFTLLEFADFLLEQFPRRKSDQRQLVDRRSVLLLRRTQNSEMY